MNIILAEGNKESPTTGSPVAFEFYKKAMSTIWPKWHADLVFDNGDRWEYHQTEFKSKKHLLANLVDLTSSHVHKKGRYSPEQSPAG